MGGEQREVHRFFGGGTQPVEIAVARQPGETNVYCDDAYKQAVETGDDCSATTWTWGAPHTLTQLVNDTRLYVPRVALLFKSVTGLRRADRRAAAAAGDTPAPPRR